jgi:hypothetical protein
VALAARSRVRLQAALVLAALAAAAPPAQAERRGRALFVDLAGGAAIGVGGLAAAGATPGLAAAVGASAGPWALGVGVSRAPFTVAPGRFAYFIICWRDFDCPPQPTLTGAATTVDLRAAYLVPVGWIARPYLDGALGWSHLGVGGGPGGDLTLDGRHAAGGAGVELPIDGPLALFAAAEYSFSLLARPPSIVTGGGLSTDLIFIANHAHQVQAWFGLRARVALP